MIINIQGCAGDCTTCQLVNRNSSKCMVDGGYILPKEWKSGKREACPAKNSVIAKEDISEFTGQILDIFEDFLEEKGVQLSKQDTCEEEPVVLYGTDYDILQEKIKDMLTQWGIVEKDRTGCST